MPLATDFGLRLIYVILFVTALGFLGLGVQPPTAEWGAMIFQNRVGLQKGFDAGALAGVCPALAIASLTTGKNRVERVPRDVTVRVMVLIVVPSPFGSSSASSEPTTSRASSSSSILCFGSAAATTATPG